MREHTLRRMSPSILWRFLKNELNKSKSSSCEKMDHGCEIERQVRLITFAGPGVKARSTLFIKPYFDKKAVFGQFKGNFPN